MKREQMEYAKDLGDPRATQESIVHYGYVVDKRVGDQGRVPQQKPLGVGIAIPKQPGLCFLRLFIHSSRKPQNLLK